MTLIDNFWEYVDQSGGPDACWPWTRGRIPSGYGGVVIYGRRHSTHRVAYVLAKGLIPYRMMVMHSCDNPPCCNPAHLTVGTPVENAADMVRKGRHVDNNGERHGMAKLTNDAVRAMRAAYTGEPEQIRAFAVEHGVSVKTIQGIVYGKSWKAVV